MERTNELELFYMLALSLIDGLGAKSAKRLLEEYGSAEFIFQYGPGQNQEHPFFPKFSAQTLKESQVFARAEEEMGFISKQQVQVLTLQDPTYPNRLLNCDDGPILLFYKGENVLNYDRVISIVGARNATSYGRSVCRSLIRDLKRFHPVIISGLAYGIDVIAHQEAVTMEIPTVAVLGHGLDMVYPEAHETLAKNMMNNGGLVTEFFSKTKLERFNFPMRNRIIAGLADVTIVVEAAEKGGALITAKFANDYHRDVCAIPGNVNQEYSKGCNYLIQSHSAALITSAEDLAKVMQWPTQKKQFSVNENQFKNCNPPEQDLLRVLQSSGRISLDELVQLTGQHVSALSLTLLQLELKNYIVSLPGNFYEVI